MKIATKLILISVIYLLYACTHHAVTMVGDGNNTAASNRVYTNTAGNAGGAAANSAKATSGATASPAGAVNTGDAAGMGTGGASGTGFSGSRKVGTAYVIDGVDYYPLTGMYQETGIASWYGYEFDNDETSNGEIADMYSFTASHKTLPMPTYVLVENLENGRETVVRINDRGPFIKRRIIDVSYAAANQLDFLKKGTAMVRIIVLSENPERLVIEGKEIDLNKGRYSVQIGEFEERINADALAAQYETGTVIVPWKTHYNQQMFRVRIRGYQSRMEAETALKGFLVRYPEAFIVAE